MQAEIITIGDEILIGQIIDSNSAWIAQQLNVLGIEVAQIRSIADTDTAISEALRTCQKDTILVLLTGGLGPTKDDITKQALCSFFESTLQYHPEVFAHIKQLFASFGKTPTALNKEQAYLPEKCTVLPNNVGTAAGMLFQKNGVYFVSMPGVPFEMKHIMTQHVLPLVAQRLVGNAIVHHTLLTVGVPESELAEQLDQIEEKLPEHIKMAYLPRPGMVRLRLTAKGTNEEKLKSEILDFANQIKSILGNIVYGANLDTLEEVVGNLLLENNQTLATAESCTGGFLAHKITSVPGSSSYFLGSVIAYANSVKISTLHVEENALASCGAVSERVVLQMAKNVKHKFNTTWGVATSGIAGPSGGSAEKPVGTVWIAVAGPKNVIAQKFQFGNNRERNIKKATFAALNMLRNKLLEA